MADAIDAEATSSLRFQQGALGAGVGTIDLISQQHLNERQAGPKAEAGPSRTEHVQALRSADNRSPVKLTRLKARQSRAKASARVDLPIPGQSSIRMTTGQ